MLSSAGTTYHPIAVDFLTRSYRIVGKVLVSHTGLLGLMTGTSTSVIEVQDAQLARLNLPNLLADQYPLARLVKRQIIAVCVGRRDDLGALGMSSLATVNQYPVRILTADYEVSGLLEWPGRFDVVSVLGQNTGEFIPLYRANITSILLPDMTIDTPVLLINRTAIDLVALAQQQPV